MSANTLSFLNFGIHSLLLSALGWLVVRFVVRDALRRSIAASLVMLFSLIGPLVISHWPYPYLGDYEPVLVAIHQTVETDWRIVVPAQNEVTAAAAEPIKEPSFTMNETVRGLRGIFWAGVVLMLLRHLWHTWAVLRWCWRLRDLTQAESEALPRDFRFKRIRVFEHEGTPCVAGWLRPVIAVPASAFQKLSPQQWRWLMRHEEEHLRGNDTLSIWLHGCLRALLWWNPFVHALIEEFARAREEVCDAAALGHEGRPTAYADFLINWAAQPQLNAVGVMPIASSRPARRLKARLVALIETRSVRKKAGGLFTLACAAAVFLGPMLVASVGFAISATRVSAEEPKPATPQVDDGRMHTRVFRVPPTFGGGMTAKTFLESQGIPFPEGASALFTKTTSQLIARNTRSHLDKIEQMVEASTRLPVQVHMTSKLIQADRLFGTHGKILSRQEADDLVRSVSQSKGANLMSTPSVTTLSDQPAQVQVVHTNPANAQEFVGVRLELVAARLPNGKAKLQAKAELSAESDASRPWPPKAPNEINWSGVRLHSVSDSGELATGETLVLHLTTQTRPVTILVSAKAIKPGGADAESFNEVAGAAAHAPPTSKQVRLAVKVAEVSAPLGKIHGDWDPGAMTWQADAASKPVPINKAPTELRHQFAISGVLTPDQFSSVIRALAQKKGVTITTLPDGIATSGRDTDFDLLDRFNGRKLRINATAAPDGQTLNVEALPPDLAPNQKRLVVTSVGIWSGQTIILSGMPSDKPGQTLIFFITGTLLDEEAQK